MSHFYYMLFGLNFQSNSISWLLRVAVGMIWMIVMIKLAHVPQTEFSQIITLYVIVFLVYGLVLKFDSASWKFWLLVGVLARMLLVPAFPLLSNDIYRFYFDGLLLVSGQSPYGIIPMEWASSGQVSAATGLLENMNSASYYTVYPPLLQYLFGLSALAPTIQVGKTILALVFLAIEGMGIFFLVKILTHLKKDSSNILFYVLNPLVIMEGMANVHAEVIMVAWLAMAFYLVILQRHFWGGAMFGLAVGTKFLPLLLMPLLFRYLLRENRNPFFAGMLISVLVLFIPFVFQPGFFSFLESIDLYFRKFEFNAGIYFLLRNVGTWLSGYNLIGYIGPFLGILTLVSILRLSSKYGKNDISAFFAGGNRSWYIYLLLATTVHPWYVIPLVFFSSLTGLTGGLIWSGLIFTSYIHYSPALQSWEPWLLVFQYAGLFSWIAWECKWIPFPGKKTLA